MKVTKKNIKEFRADFVDKMIDAFEIECCLFLFSHLFN